MNKENLQLLLDRTKIEDVYTKYTLSVDNRDWNSLESVFTTDLERDFSAFTGSPIEVIKSKQHVEESRATLPGFDSTQHFILNKKIEINEDRATAIVYMIADHTLSEDGEQKQFTINGVYTFQLLRNELDWKISGLKLNVMSTKGDQGLFEIAGKRMAKKKS